MTARQAYDRLARTPGYRSRGVARLLALGHPVEEVAQRLADPQGPEPVEPFVTPSCCGYPALLKEMADHPLRLFHRGQPLHRISPHCVAVVGSRKASSYGLCWSRRLGHALARAGISVCSGLALGIDAAAHQGALEVVIGGESDAVPVGVLAHGWEHQYPTANKRLRRQMEQHGVLWSEYPPAHPPARWTFPERNRIIAGLSQVVVVVEASQRSGSLHTARFANEAGRDVWVVPNRPGTPNSAGVLSLLRDGASPMFTIEEFVSQVSDELRLTHPRPPFEPLASPLSSLLLELAQCDRGSPSELCQRLGRRPGEVAAGLAELELLGLIGRSIDGTWSVLRWDLVEQELQAVRERGIDRPAA